jgi:hypothetical protein
MRAQVRAEKILGVTIAVAVQVQPCPCVLTRRCTISLQAVAKCGF